VLVTTLCALGGVLVGKKFLHKITMEKVRILIGVLLIVVGLMLALGIA